MPLNLTLLRSFYEVITAGSVSKAARSGFASQPALSKAVRELEKQLGLTLIERSTKGSTPTQAGKELYEYASAIFALEARAEASIKAHKGLSSSTLRIGASTTIGTYILPSYIKQFSLLHPGVSIELTRGNSREIERRIWNYEFDIAIILGPPQEEKLEFKIWKEDEMVCICHPEHPLAQKEIVFLDDLKNSVWVRREEGSGARLYVEKSLQSHGVIPNIDEGYLEIGGCEALKQSVAAGLGIAFVSRQAAADQIALKKVKVLPIDEVEIRSPFYFLRIPGRPLTPAAKSFETFLFSSR
jgi:DNA-binding transcriptional LysR family regulator